MARDNETQHLKYHNGYAIDYGMVEFTTTGTTVEIYTPLSKIFEWSFFPAQNPTGNERFYLNETVTGVGPTYANCGFIAVPSTHAVTLTRVPEYVEYTHTLSADEFSSNDLVQGVLFSTPRALTLSQVVWVNSAVAWGGSPVLCLGSSEDGDPDDFVNDRPITATAYITTAISTFVSKAVAAGTDVRYISTGGTTSDPIGACLTVQAYVALTSGLKMCYQFKGLD
jgi:hypothetical protein